MRQLNGNQEPSPEFDKHTIPRLLETLRASLPRIANDLVRRNLDMSKPQNRSFALHPDSALEHAPEWHQKGILTHSYKFAEALQTTVPAYIEKWGLTRPVATILAEEVDSIPKNDLLQIVALVHDIGKFTARHVTEADEIDIRSTSFKGHEEHSGRLVRHELAPLLRQWGLRDAHIEYIATCAELHFELGKIRRAAKANYSIAFVDSPGFTSAAEEILAAHPGHALEIGIEFMADSLSKTEIIATAETDDEIALERPKLETQLAAQGLNPQLIHQVLQQPVNMKVAEKYLQLWAVRNTTNASWR